MTIDSKARQLLDRRLEAFRSLNDTLDKIGRARADLDAREQDAWAAAMRSGWSHRDLTGLGLAAPKRLRPVRKPRTAEKASSPDWDTAPSQANADEFAS